MGSLGLGKGGGDPCLGYLEQTCHCIHFRAIATTRPLAVNLEPHSARGHPIPPGRAALGFVPGEPQSPESLGQTGQGPESLAFFLPQT